MANTWPGYDAYRTPPQPPLRLVHNQRRAASALIADFDAAQERWGLRESTRKIRRWLLDDLAAHVDPLTATAEDIDAWLDAHDIGIKARRTYLSMAKQFFKWMHDTGRRADDPARLIRSPRVPRAIPRPIDTDDLRQALDHADPLLRAWLTLGAFAGLRCREIAQLRREAIIDTTTPPVLVVEDGKGGKQRTIPLHPDVLAALHAYGMPPAGPIFCLKAAGKVTTPSTVSRYVGTFFHDLGMPWTAHALRHWFATEVYRASLDLRATQELLGHQSPTTTAGYTAWSPEATVGIVRGLRI